MRNDGVQEEIEY